MDKADDYASTMEYEGPRLTREEIDAVVQASRRQYHTFPDTTVTVCLITMQDGYEVVGMGDGQRMAVADAKARLFDLHGAEDKPTTKRGPRKKKFFAPSDQE